MAVENSTLSSGDYDNCNHKLEIGNGTRLESRMLVGPAWRMRVQPKAAPGTCSPPRHSKHPAPSNPPPPFCRATRPPKTLNSHPASKQTDLKLNPTPEDTTPVEVYAGEWFVFACCDVGDCSFSPRVSAKTSLGILVPREA